jgi:hypothetical protein
MSKMLMPRQSGGFMNRTTLGKLALFAVLATATFASSCTNPYVGTYSNANGSIVLDIKSGDKASLTLMGETKQCTYQAEKEQLTLDCGGDKLVFTKHDDGSLTGPGMIGMLKKSK